MALWADETVRSATGAPFHTLAASRLSASLCRSSTLLTLSPPLPPPPPPGAGWAKAGETARAAAAQRREIGRIGRESLAGMSGLGGSTLAKVSFARQPSPSTNRRLSSANAGTRLRRVRAARRVSRLIWRSPGRLSGHRSRPSLERGAPRLPEGEAR